ncbi:hypothetical protein [Paraburkholderia sp. 2C]
MKAAGDQSLRLLVEKWLAPLAATPLHVTHFGRTRNDGTRYVRVEASSVDGPRALFFFRHDDGCWCVFPPTTDRVKRMSEPFAVEAA